MLNLGDVVKTTKEYPQEGIALGEKGTIVMCFQEPAEGYEVEFLDKDGYTKAVLTLTPQDFELA